MKRFDLQFQFGNLSNRIDFVSLLDIHVFTIHDFNEGLKVNKKTAIHFSSHLIKIYNTLRFRFIGVV